MITFTIIKQDLIDTFEDSKQLLDEHRQLDDTYCSKCILSKVLSNKFELSRSVLVFNSGIHIPSLNGDYKAYYHSEETKYILDEFDYIVNQFINEKEYKTEYEALLDKLPITTTMEKKIYG